MPPKKIVAEINAAAVSTASATAADPPKGSAQFLDKAEVLSKVRLTYPTIWKMMREGKFPRSRDSATSKAMWLEDEVEQWMRNRPATVLKAPDEKIAAES
ncbi:helix-turn-helix transcriptional regulator [Bradyrhizobium erythrophlei]|uniref:Transcriptional regulator, AlpA family n=1 Tax=Bradyrhizobium erythrophlei TaxID=1437360 RepID=A0A1M5I8Q2_9BRAD|nr:AlpA family phage regulatory protein [Bradyrhizobium erythrophlei]SHG24768.1 transcriptional regulator, AlpA family [Bradyrhizobium erythrophlei]